MHCGLAVLIMHASLLSSVVHTFLAYRINLTSFYSNKHAEARHPDRESRYGK